ncbi:MAG: toxic anion resistance protein [Oscillospiraceae bacterium]|nr:toxic anion resistance protein [Oscillospiraceae bacterium]
MFDAQEPIVLDLGLQEENKPAVVEAEIAQPEAQPEIVLSPEEQAMVDAFSEKIDLHNTSIILQYGAASQKKIASFSDSVLDGVKTKELGETGEMITSLITELKGFDTEEEEGGFLGLFKKAGNKLSRMRARYADVEKNVTGIVTQLEGHQNRLMTDIVVFDKMYEANLTYFKELTMYILAGKKKLALERSTTLVQMQETAKRSGLAHDAQAANDYQALCDRFEKKLHDLQLTRTISIQMAPQIRLLQNNHALLAEKIQSTLNNTIPLWKNQMVLALGMEHSRQALQAQREVTDMTNALLKKNAETLKMGTIEVAQESERGIVDMETIRYTNEQLISTLDEVLKIQTEGRQKRAAAEVEIAQIEAQLRQKLLGGSDGQQS